MSRLPLFLCLCFIAVFNAGANNINIGVLAYNGEQRALERWQPIADYLSKSILAHKFTISALTLQAFENALNKKELDFIVTNPGHYVALEHKFGASRMLTFLPQHGAQTLKEFSAVIFTRKDSGIKQLKDLKGKSFAAVSPKAFGGFQLAQDAFLNQSIDLVEYADVKWLGFPHTDIVKAVLSKNIDVGTVRAGVLENMADAGIINLEDVRILAPKQTLGYPFLHSVGIYPEWPLAKLPWTDVLLARKVAISLLKIHPNSSATAQKFEYGWTIPLDYTVVRKVLQRLQADPYAGKIQSSKSLRNYKYWLLSISATIALLLFFLFRFFAKNKILKNKQYDNNIKNHDLQGKLNSIDLELKYKTTEYLQTKKSLSADFQNIQDLYDIFLDNDIKQEQKLNLIVSAVRKGLNMECGLLSQFNNNEFKLCGASVQNDIIASSPIDKTLSHEAIKSPGIYTRSNNKKHKRYIAYAIFTQNKPQCLFEFSSSQALEVPKFGLKLLNLAAQHVGREILRMEKDQYTKQRDTKIQQRFSAISKREMDVLLLLSAGNSNKVIARNLDISPKTVEMHRANLIKKTGAKSSIELVQLAVLAEIVSKI